jgi:hypothetical protein
MMGVVVEKSEPLIRENYDVSLCIEYILNGVFFARRIRRPSPPVDC